VLQLQPHPNPNPNPNLNPDPNLIPTLTLTLILMLVLIPTLAQGQSGGLQRFFLRIYGISRCVSASYPPIEICNY